MHEKKRIAILRLLEDTDINDVDKMNFCVKCENIIQQGNFYMAGIDRYNFLVICNSCKKDIQEENNRIQEIERLQKNKIRLQQMKDYVKLNNSWPEERENKVKKLFYLN